MRILVVSSYLPYPLDSGGHIRLFNLLTYLSKRHELTLVCEMRAHQTQDDLAAVREICKDVFPVPRRKQWSAGNIAKSALGGDPFLVVGHTNFLMQEELKHLFATKTFDLIHIETFYVSQNLPSPKGVPVVLVEHNIEYEVYQKFADKVTALLRPALLRDVRKLQRSEEAAWGTASCVVAVSENERQVIARIAQKTALVPNGVSLSDFPLKGEKPPGRKLLLFIGNFKWLQNRDAALWLLKEVWPQLKDKGDFVLRIVGKHIPENIRSFASDGVVIDTNATENTSQIFREAYLLLAPIWIGGGTSYKILESMASGTPVITTPLGLAGIEAKDGESIVVANTPGEFVSRIHALVQDGKLYESIAENARKIIEKTYSWDRIGGLLEDVYREAVSEKSS